MLIFDLAPELYFDLVKPAVSPNGRTVAQNIALTEHPIAELITRYDLAGKSVLSLGPRFGHEEYWMWRAGCRLTLIDIDEQHDILPYLHRLPTGSGLRFVIGDAFAWSAVSNEQFDVLYTGGFGPQELRRAEFLAEGQSWDISTPFYDPRVLQMCAKYIVSGGIYLNQSYFAGPSLTEEIIDSMEEQLAQYGFKLLEINAWQRTPSIHLDVAIRGHDTVLVERLAQLPPMTRIHGRSELQECAVTRLFPPDQRASPSL